MQSKLTNYRKRYVGIYLFVDVDGTEKPAAIKWDSKTIYKIDEVLDQRLTHGSKSNLDGIRYTIRIGKKVTHLWNSGKYWHVQERYESDAHLD